MPSTSESASREQSWEVRRENDRYRFNPGTNVEREQGVTESLGDTESCPHHHDHANAHVRFTVSQRRRLGVDSGCTGSGEQLQLRATRQTASAKPTGGEVSVSTAVANVNSAPRSRAQALAAILRNHGAGLAKRLRRARTWAASLEPGPTLVDMVTTGFGPGGQ